MKTTILILLLTATSVFAGNYDSCNLKQNEAYKLSDALDFADKVTYLVSPTKSITLQAPFFVERLGNTSSFLVLDSSDQNVGCLIPSKTMIESNDDVIFGNDLISGNF